MFALRCGPVVGLSALTGIEWAPTDSKEVSRKALARHVCNFELHFLVLELH